MKRITPIQIIISLVGIVLVVYAIVANSSMEDSALVFYIVPIFILLVLIGVAAIFGLVSLIEKIQKK